MCTHTKHTSGQFIHAASTYKAVMTKIDQIRYLLSRPLTCPIYVLNGASPRDSSFHLITSLGPYGFVYNTWFCQPIRGLDLDHAPHTCIISHVTRSAGLISSLIIRQYTTFEAFSSSLNTSPHRVWQKFLLCLVASNK